MRGREGRYRDRERGWWEEGRESGESDRDRERERG